jgi:hypothetical protein
MGCFCPPDLLECLQRGSRHRSIQPVALPGHPPKTLGKRHATVPRQSGLSGRDSPDGPAPSVNKSARKLHLNLTILRAHLLDDFERTPLRLTIWLLGIGNEMRCRGNRQVSLRWYPCRGVDASGEKPLAREQEGGTRPRGPRERKPCGRVPRQDGWHPCADDGSPWRVGLLRGPWPGYADHAHTALQTPVDPSHSERRPLRMRR